MIKLEYSKETDGKYIWKERIKNVTFSFYIPQWRVPKPTPKSIYIEISEAKENDTVKKILEKDIEEFPELAKETIYSIVKRTSDHTQTIRYTPTSESKEAEIGEPYIPISLLKDYTSDFLLIKVKWGE